MIKTKYTDQNKITTLVFDETSTPEEIKAFFKENQRCATLEINIIENIFGMTPQI